MKFIRCSNVTIILLLLLFAFSFNVFAQNQASYIVKDLRVEDIPDDDGTGLKVSWKPLPQDKRIIEYRVYRGVTPDTLFYIGKIDVNPKTGISGERAFYYDKDYNYFLDLQAPGNLEEEKQQPENSPLYKRMPRDIMVSGKRLKHYTILGIIPEKDYFFKSRKVIKTEDGEDNYYAGLKLRNFLQLAKKLKTGKKYYYTVVAVSSSRKYYPHAKPVFGVPKDNPPQKPENLFVNLKESPTKDELYLEWTLPIVKADIRTHSFYAVPKEKEEQFDKYLAQSKKRYAGEQVKEPVPMPGKLVYKKQSAYPYTTQKNAKVVIDNGKISIPQFDLTTEITVNEIKNSFFVMSYDDANGYQTFSDKKKPNILDERNLAPIEPIKGNETFVVKDNKNDKGDYNKIMWGKPVVVISNSSYLNEDKTKILVNYDIYTNEYYQINNVYFKIFDSKGNMIDDINEFYQDKKIRLDIPSDTQNLTFEMTFNTNRELGDYTLTQRLRYNEQYRTLRPLKLDIEGENVQDYTYFVYKKPKSSSQFRLSKRISGVNRELEDNVAYENHIYQLVGKYDKKRKLFLVSPEFSLTYDKETDSTIRANLFKEAAEQKIETYKDEIQKYEAQLDTVAANRVPQIQSAIDYYEKQINNAKDNKLIKEANSKGKSGRLRFFYKTRMNDKRSFAYKVVKSDGKGNFVETNVYKTDDGKKYFKPVPNWFQTEMIPTLLATLLFGCLVYIMIKKAKKGEDLYIRPIAGIQEIDNAIGRATEMGRPILFVPGLSSIQDIATLAGLSILGRVAKKAAEYDTKILVPVRNYIVLPIAQEIVREAHYEAGRPDTYDKSSAFFITTSQFAFVAGVNGIMIREQTATNFYMGMFWAEALIMTETGNATGAIQISGTDAVTQIPFFITTCDYTLIGEELYAASAYLAREPLMLGTLKAQDYTKLVIMIFIVLGTVLSTFHLTFLINAFPEK